NDTYTHTLHDAFRSLKEMETQQISLKERWNALQQTNPHLRIRNAANELGVSEAELLATRCGEGVTRLRPEFKELLSQIETLGYRSEEHTSELQSREN